MSKRMCVKFESNRIEISEIMARKASVPFSPEFYELVKIKNLLPDYEIVVRKNRPMVRDSVVGLTYEFMRQHIANHSDSDCMEQFETLRAYGANYFEVRKWFLNQFPEIAEFPKAA